MSTPARPAFTRDDLGDIALLAAVMGAGKPRQPQAMHQGPNLRSPEAWARLRGLMERCQLVATPRAPAGVTIGVIGQARLQRFLRTPVGSTAPAADIAEECALRRLVLDAVDPEDREEIVATACRDLVTLRDGAFSCLLAETCRSGACPLAAAASVEEIDRALIWLAGDLSSMPGEQRRCDGPQGARTR